MKKRLSKALAAAGIASRRECEKIIMEGRVSVNQQVAHLPQTLVDWEKDTILIDNKAIKGEEKKVYFLVNKPIGYICTSVEKKGGAKRVLDLFSHLPYRLFTVGRLDLETSGLILVTNDGHFANAIMHPSFCITKEYLAKTGQEITEEHLKAISKGCFIQRTYVRPLEVTKVRRGTLKVVVGEGKKHEVRLLLAKAGLEIQTLIRIRIGSLTLGGLDVGKYRELSEMEIHSFLKG